MELMGGVMIMLVLLALLLCAVWLSLPILLVMQGRRLERIADQLHRLENRFDTLERRLATWPAHETTISNAVKQEGVDGTA